MQLHPFLFEFASYPLTEFIGANPPDEGRRRSGSGGGDSLISALTTLAVADAPTGQRFATMRKSRRLHGDVKVDCSAHKDLRHPCLPRSMMTPNDGAKRRWRAAQRSCSDRRNRATMDSCLSRTTGVYP